MYAPFKTIHCVLRSSRTPYSSSKYLLQTGIINFFIKLNLSWYYTVLSNLVANAVVIQWLSVFSRYDSICYIYLNMSKNIDNFEFIFDVVRYHENLFRC